MWNDGEYGRGKTKIHRDWIALYQTLRDGGRPMFLWESGVTVDRKTIPPSFDPFQHVKQQKKS